MSPGILGKKIGMTQIFRADGQVVPVTLVKAGPCVVVQRKTPATDGYDAIQLGLIEGRKTITNKALGGHLGADNVSKANNSKEAYVKTNVRFIKEIRLMGGGNTLSKGDRVLAESFQANDVVDVVGTSKGRGFASLVKRHHFRGGPDTHGSMFNRAAGSIGASSFPSRVFPGMRMAGHMGDGQVTVRNLQIVQVDTESNVLMIKGAIPGPNGGYVVVKPAKKGAAR